MPYYLRLDGIEIPVRVGSGGEDAPETSGETVRMFDNSLRSSENPAQAKRVWNFATPSLDAGTAAIIRPLVRSGAFREADGYAIDRTLLPGDTVTVWPVAKEIQHDTDGDEDISYVFNFSLQEA